MAFKCKKRRTDLNEKNVWAVNIFPKQYGLERPDGDVPHKK